ncbi:MAG: ribosome biogenesis GTPase YlqF [Lachnospiraceae bacterium]|nr:ribosome biogenesis GTPase YlqF [Lachnospiraceae bacterium]
MKIQWYPGHMTKARRAMEQDIKLVDLVIELLDARTPLASRNPDIDKLGANKLRLILLNKSDVADPAVNRRWKSWFESKGYTVVLLDSRSGAGKKQVQAAVSQVCQAKIERDRRRGILNRPVRAMVVGIPNVGKSTFINTFAGKAVAKTGNKPGVTRGNQWIRLNKEVELLDTPGILWPKFEDPEVGVHLAMIGSVNDEILDIRELACELLKLLRTLYPEKLQERYSFSEEELAQETKTGFELLEKIAKIRGCLLKGQELDTEKAARLVMDDFRSGRLGQISIERPEE